MSDLVLRPKASPKPSIYCPRCGEKTDGFPTSGPQAAEEGDFAVCPNCSQLLVFDIDLGARRPTPEEYKEAMEGELREKIKTAQWAAAEWRRRR